MKYRIELEFFEYTYRSYMACEDQREDDCIGRGHKWAVYKGERKLKAYYSKHEAKLHIKRLNKNSK